VDNIIIMQKERGQHDAELQITPREEEEMTLRLSFDPQVKTWRLEGPAEEFAKTKERQEVLNTLRNLTNGDRKEAVGPKEIAEANEDLEYENVRYLLSKMVDAENPRVEKAGYGKYKPIPQQKPPSHPSQSSQHADSDPPF
jgi:hypothetical protein